MKVKHFVYTNIPHTKYRGFGLHFKPNDTEINKILIKLIYDFKVSKELDRLFLIYKEKSIFIVFLKHINDLDESGRGGLYIAHGFVVKKDEIISLSDLIKKLQKISFKSLDEIKTSDYIVFEAGLTKDIEIDNNQKRYSFTEDDKIIYFNILKSLETDKTLLLNSDKFLDFIDYIPKKFELFLYTNFDEEKIKFNFLDKKPNILTYQTKKPKGEYIELDTKIITRNIPLQNDIDEWYEIKDKKLDIDRFLSIKSKNLKIFFLNMYCNSLLQEIGINGVCNREIGQYFISEYIQKEIDILKKIKSNSLSLKEFVSISCQKIKETILDDRLTKQFLSELKLDVELQKSREYFLSNDIIENIENLYNFQKNKSLKNFISLSNSLKEFLLTDILCEYFLNELELDVELQKSREYFLSNDIVQNIEDLYNFQKYKSLKKFISLNNSLKEFLLTHMLGKYFLKELKVNADIEFKVLKSIFLENNNIDSIKARLFDYLNKTNQMNDDLMKSKFLSLFLIIHHRFIQSDNINKIYSILDSLQEPKNIFSLFEYLEKQELLEDIVKYNKQKLEIMNNLVRTKNLNFLQNLIEDKNSLELLEKIKKRNELEPIIKKLLNLSQQDKNKKSKLKEIKKELDKLFGIKGLF